jgi:hypothetical protein
VNAVTAGQGNRRASDIAATDGICQIAGGNFGMKASFVRAAEAKVPGILFRVHCSSKFHDRSTGPILRISVREAYNGPGGVYIHI